jgi:hypothetical protein
MEPTSQPSPQRLRIASILLWLAIGASLLTCGGLGYFVYQLSLGPYVDRVIWYYDDFHMVGAPSRPDSLRAEGELPRNIVVEGTTSRFDPNQKPGEYPRSIVKPDGRRVELSTITWESANAISTSKEPLDLGNGEVLVDMLDQGGGTNRLSVHFEGERFKSHDAWGHVRITNTSNGQSFELLRDDWSAVERVFGKPKRKEQVRSHVGWGTGS